MSVRDRRRISSRQPLIGAQTRVEVYDAKSLRAAIARAGHVVLTRPVWIDAPLAIDQLKRNFVLECIGEGTLGTTGDNTLIEIGAAAILGAFDVTFQRCRFIGGSGGPTIKGSADNGDLSLAVNVRDCVAFSGGADFIEGTFSDLAVTGCNIARGDIEAEVSTALISGNRRLNGCVLDDIDAAVSEAAIIGNACTGDVEVRFTSSPSNLSVVGNVVRSSSPDVACGLFGGDGVITGNAGFGTYTPGTATLGTNA